MPPARQNRPSETRNDETRVSGHANVHEGRSGEKPTADVNPLLTDKEIGVIQVGPYARQLYFVIPGSPVPAVRMTQRSKFVNPRAQNYLAWKEGVGHVARQAMGDTEPFTDAIILSIDIRMNGDRRNRKQRPWDLENVDKAIGDALNGIAYRDDWQVECIWSEIHIGVVDEVRVKVIELGGHA